MVTLDAAEAYTSFPLCGINGERGIADLGDTSPPCRPNPQSSIWRTTQFRTDLVFVKRHKTLIVRLPFHTGTILF